MKVVVGLGNPGSGYAGTRHNVGFAVVDLLASRLEARFAKKDFHAILAEAVVQQQKILLVKPQAFMNRSGASVGALTSFFQLPLEDLLVVCDDINLPLGKLRARARGTHGGHNGLRDIQNHLGTSIYSRLRIGVDAPEGKGAVEHVLGRFGAGERRLIEEAVDKAAIAIELWIKDGIAACMNQYNG